MNLSRIRYHAAVPVAALVGLSACGDDTPSTPSDATASDATPVSTGDSTIPSDTDDTTGPLDTASDAASDAVEDAMEDVGADTVADTAQDTTADAAEDTAADTTSEDVVTPATASAALVAWEGLNPMGPQRGSIQVSVSTGSAFGAFRSWKAGSDPAPVVFGATANLLGDLDGDGKGDLVAWTGRSTTSPNFGSIMVSLSSGAAFGDFVPWKAGTVEAPVVFGSTANLLGDVDGDDRADLVAWNGRSTTSPNFGAISVMLSTGTSFADATTWRGGTLEAPIVFGSTANLLGDVDGDGRADLVAWNGRSTTSPNFGSILVSLSNGEAFGTFTSWKSGTLEAPVLFGSAASLVGDVDGDGRADLVAWDGRSTTRPNFGSIGVMLSTGSSFENATTWLAGTLEAPIDFGETANLLADVNGDGRADLIAWTGRSTTSPNFGGIRVFLSTGTGFAPPATWFAGSLESPTLFGGTANLAGATAD